MGKVKYHVICYAREKIGSGKKRSASATFLFFYQPCSPSPVPSALPSPAQAFMLYVYSCAISGASPSLSLGPSSFPDRKEHELKGFGYGIRVIIFP
jgi:hypothetical protein